MVEIPPKAVGITKTVVHSNEDDLPRSAMFSQNTECGFENGKN